MISRFLVMLFVGLVGFGLWFQRTYMDLSSQEFRAELASDRSQAELFRALKLQVFQNKNQRNEAVFEAATVRYLNSGRLIAKGNVTSTLNREPEPLVIRSTVAEGKLDKLRPDEPFLESPKEFTSVFLPEDVRISRGFDVMYAKKVDLDLLSRCARSRESFRWVGPFRTLNGRGFDYWFDLDKLLVHGPVSGEVRL